MTAIDAEPKRPGTLAQLETSPGNRAVAVLADGWDEDWTRLWWLRLDGEAAIAESRRARSQLCDRYQQYQRQPPEGPVIVVRAVRWSGWRASAG